ncbi:MAG: type IV pilus assembly protein PilM [Calditrichaeota bacterium]|nr:type IV pilus assembly protein PilM [Calditrichota bacterium]MCB9391047.1 type IV pilus assembly protein PilM [Calditrichota bacterium]
MAKRNKYGIGIDIDSKRIHVAGLKASGEGVTVEKLACVDLPQESLVDGAWMDGLALSEILANLAKDLHLKGKDVAVSVGGRQLMIKKITTDDMSDDELRGAIEYEADANLPFNISQVSLDYARQHQDVDSGRMEVLLVAAKNEVVFDSTEPLAWAGMKPTLLEAAPFAIQAALTESGYLDDEGIVGVLHIGFQSTEVMLYEFSQFETSRSIPTGGKAFVEGLIRRCGFGFEKALGVLARDSRTEEEQDALDVVARATSERLAEQIERALPEYLGVLAEKPISKLLLCGGGANLPCLQSAIRHRFGLDVEVANPFRRMNSAGKDVSIPEGGDGAGYSCAIGLALRAMGGEHPGFNLIFTEDRPETKRASYLGASAIVPILGFSAVLLGILIVHLNQVTKLNGLEARLEAIREETDLYRDKIAVVEDLTVKRADVSSRIDVIRELDRNRFARLDVLEMLARRLPSLTWLTSTKEAPTPNGSGIHVSGITSSNTKVAEFMTALLQEPEVRAVDLLVTQQTEIAGTEVTEFTLQVAIPTIEIQVAKPRKDNLLKKGADAIKETNAALEDAKQKSARK